jgi:hypothetical protein
VLVAWHKDRWSGSHFHLSSQAITVKLVGRSSSPPWWLTMVYGLQGDQKKLAFLNDLRGLRCGHIGPWLLCGNFNLIYKAEGKNNNRLNR